MPPSNTKVEPSCYSEGSSTFTMETVRTTEKLPGRQHGATSPGPRHLSKAAKREMMLNLIAKEMADAWLGDEETSLFKDPQANGNAECPSAEDIFYAQMNGEMVGTADREQDPSHDVDQGAHDGEDEFDCDGSFYDLTIPDTSQEQEHDLFSLENGRNTGPPLVISPSCPSSSLEDDLSLDEVKAYVFENIPLEALQKIPEEALDQILGDAMPDKTRKPSRQGESGHGMSKFSDMADSVHSATGMSDISASSRTYKVDELGWDEELCPGPSSNNNNMDASRRSSGSGVDCSRRSSVGSASYMVDASGSIRETSSTRGKVSFSHVQIRYYQRILDINPSVTSGPAIGIGWNYKRGGSIHVHDWEVQRGGTSRRSNELILPRFVREKLLTDVGYTKAEIAEAVRIIRKAKDRRKVTVQHLGTGTEAMEEKVEAAARRIKGILSLGWNKRA